MIPLLILLFIVFFLLALLIFVVLTEGKYFGKGFLRRLYNLRAGAFEIRDDWELWEHLIERLNIGATEQILDLGTQTGHLPRILARKRAFQGSIVGIDWSDEMIQEAKRQARLEGSSEKIRFLCSDIRHPLPFPDQTFTMVVCVTGILDGLRNPEKLLKEVRRVLQPEGRLACSFSPTGLGPGSQRDQQWFSAHLAEIGFFLSEIIPWTSMHKILIARLKNSG